jgi:IS605 OrfB family transposase
MNKTLIRTICIKLDVDGHEATLAATQRAFNAAASWIAQICWNEGITNTNTAHHRVYGETRLAYGLGAQVAVCARAKAVEAIKAVKTKRRDSGVLGVDVGIVNLATDSAGEAFSGTAVKKARPHYHTRRQRLQQVGTKSAKRRLRTNAGRERRFQKDVNHCISKALVKKAAVSCKAIALEDLSGIRERVTVRHEQRYARHSWAFYQLRAFLTYKAAWAAVSLHLVAPRNTSRTCSACGHCEKANRKSQAEFLCQRCGFTCNAD